MSSLPALDRPRNGTSSLTQDVYERLRDEVLSCNIRPGEKLKINELVARLDANQGAVREALSRLTSEGLVTAEPQKGFRASPISGAELADLTRVRIEIESLCLRRAIELGDVRWESDLMAAYHTLSKTAERSDNRSAVRMTDSWSQVHGDFHDRLIAACDSPWLLRIRQQLFLQAERYRRLSVPLQSVVRDTNAEHLAIMKAAIDRAPDKACKLLAKHFETTAQILHKALGLDPLHESDHTPVPSTGRGRSPARSAIPR